MNAYNLQLWFNTKSLQLWPLHTTVLYNLFQKLTNWSALCTSCLRSQFRYKQKFVFRVSTPHSRWKLICTDINTDVSLSEALVKWGISLKCSTGARRTAFTHNAESQWGNSAFLSSRVLNVHKFMTTHIFKKQTKNKLIKYLSSLSTSDNKFRLYNNWKTGPLCSSVGLGSCYE